MEPLEYLHYVDHTQLKAFATWQEIESLCDEAVGIVKEYLMKCKDAK